MLKDQLKQDINQYFNNSEKMLLEDKKKALMLLFEKYMHLDTSDLLLNKYDFNRIKEDAIQRYKDRAFPRKFNNGGGGEISAFEAPNACLVEATISYLHSEDCLKKFPKFNYKKR